jgi:hydrogenase nickel incorporation protein HypA/HybF
MHEMSLIEGVLRVVEEQAVVHKFNHVKTIWLEIGELSAVDPDALSFCFEAIRPGTLAETAKMEIIRTPGLALCTDCGKQVNVAERYASCPECGSERLQINGGDEMRIKELEVE